MLNVRNGTGITAIFNFGSRLSVYDSLPLGPKGNVKSRSSSLRSVKPARESAVRMSEHEIHSRVLDHVSTPALGRFLKLSSALYSERTVFTNIRTYRLFLL